MTSSDTSSVPTDLTVSSADHSEVQTVQRSDKVPALPKLTPQNVPARPQPQQQSSKKLPAVPQQQSTKIIAGPQQPPQESHHRQLSQLQHQLALAKQESSHKDALIQKINADYKLQVSIII